MLIVHVHVHVKPDQVDTFRAASMENAANCERGGTPSLKSTEPTCWSSLSAREAASAFPSTCLANTYI